MGTDYTTIGSEKLFFQDVGCDGTDISENIDSDVRVHIQCFGTISLLYMHERFYFVVLYLYL